MIKFFLRAVLTVDRMGSNVTYLKTELRDLKDRQRIRTHVNGLFQGGNILIIHLPHLFIIHLNLTFYMYPPLKIGVSKF